MKGRNESPTLSYEVPYTDCHCLRKFFHSLKVALPLWLKKKKSLIKKQTNKNPVISLTVEAPLKKVVNNSSYALVHCSISN